MTFGAQRGTRTARTWVSEYLTFTTLCTHLADDKLMMFFPLIFPPENGLGHFLINVYQMDTLHEMAKSIF